MGNRRHSGAALPAGDYFVYGMDAEVTGNKNLGLGGYQTGKINSTQSATSTAVVQTATTVVNPFFSSAPGSVGSADGQGGVNPVRRTAGSYFAAGTINSAKSAYGANASAELYSGQLVKPFATSNTTFTLTASVTTQALQYIVKGITASGSAMYYNASFVPGVIRLLRCRF